MENINKFVPLFSIIIPTLNEEKYLPNLLNDLINQTFKDFEIIIVDAKSEDKTKLEAEKYKKKFKKIKLVTSNLRNVSYQRNLGAKYANTNWLIFMDADNRIPKYFLQGIKFNLEMLEPDILSSWVNPDTNKSRDKAIATISNIFCDLQQNTKNPYIYGGFICTNNRVFNNLQGFDENLYWAEDADLLRRAAKQGIKFVFIRTPNFKTSFRRFRKEGILKSLQSAAILEFTRLQNKKLSKNKARLIYPMEGGKFFEIDKSREKSLKKFFSKLFLGAINKKSNGFIRKFLAKINNNNSLTSK